MSESSTTQKQLICELLVTIHPGCFNVCPHANKRESKSLPKFEVACLECKERSLDYSVGGEGKEGAGGERLWNSS
jgi:hypothetical protein